ncbi:MAG TPA: phage baseplate assembly protein V [Pyrinomonadaceae bacterium]|nr:phage baseplate assembly protein V [Pyrinomonadaceae bacterium]
MQRENGILVGIVTDLDDPDTLGRVRVRFPYLGDQLSYWAKISSPMAGNNRGFFFRPEVEDEVLVAFEMGDPRRPYVLGALWSKVDPPPPDDGKPTENNWRFIRSRSGHILKFDDTQGSERIEIIDKDNKHKIVIDTSGDKIQILCDTGNIEIKAPSGKLQIEAMDVEVKATASMKLEATGDMTISGKVVNIN